MIIIYILISNVRALQFPVTSLIVVIVMFLIQNMNIISLVMYNKQLYMLPTLKTMVMATRVQKNTVL